MQDERPRFAPSLDDLPEAVIAAALTGQILYWNRAAETIFGLPREQALGRDVIETIIVSERREEARERLRAAMVAGEASFELVCARPDGSRVYADLTMQVTSEAGAAPHVVLCLRNVTEQKRLKEEITRQYEELVETSTFLNNILQSSTEYSIIAKDLEGNILAWNEGARRNYGYTAEEMVGKQKSRILHTREELDSGKVGGALETALRTGTFEGQFQRVRKNGDRFTAQVAITLRRDAAGMPVGYLVMSKDITEQKALEAELQRKNEEIAAQYRRAQEANRLKSEFLANMSHELRTPLNAIIGFAELMHDEKVGTVSADQKEFLGDILTSSRHLLQLINDVLDLAKVEAGKVEFRPEPVDLSQVIGEVRDILRTLAAQKRIAVEVAVDPALADVVADPAKLKQVLYNYLSNALKFSPDEGRVQVRAVAEGARELRLEVEDTGIGIEPEDLGRLFVEFQQLDASTAKKYAGTGLGLALTKRIVEAQGGRLGVQSTPGKGSVFFAVLPRVAAPPAQEPDNGTAAGIPGGRSVLVIDDDANDRNWLVRTLADAGYAVEAVATGGEALLLCRDRVFDAITLDLLLPDMTGRDILQAIRGGGPNRDTPVIVASVLAEKGIGTGFKVHDILQKPVQSLALLASLDRAAIPANGDRSILVVDDDEVNLKLAEKTLGQLGYRPVCRSSAAAALQAAAEEPPAAVVLDLLMPEMDGFEFLRRFRADANAWRTPVIVWTVKDLTPGERAQLRSSVRAIVSKGEGTAALIEALENHVSPPGGEDPRQVSHGR